MDATGSLEWPMSSTPASLRIHAHAVQPTLKPLPRVRNIIAIGSGKGGVGKSTTAVNLALALAADGARVGVLDADVYGPSVPMMLGLSGRPDSPDGKSIEPMRAHGIEAMSIGLLVEQDTPMIWRGPMATSALTQLLNETRWGGGEGLDASPLDYLIVDLPPGTGDIQLTLAQKIPVAGAVIVTTPQDIATLDARKALKMFAKVEVPVLGLIENMAVHICTQCGHAEHVFGSGGGERMAAQYGVPLLGSLPLEIGIREQGDAGVPIVASSPDCAVAQAYRATARRMVEVLSQRPRAAMGISASLV
ncbi:MAG: iron-sulfur cluster carrier protein ApbC [Luteimonas sp.]